MVQNIHNDVFINYFNVEKNQLFTLYDFDAEEFNPPVISFQFTIEQNVNIIDLKFTTLKVILTNLGGYYSAIFHLSLFLVSPFLYKFFNSSVAQDIQKQSASTLPEYKITRECRQRINFVNLYHLHTTVEKIEQSHMLKYNLDQISLNQKLMFDQLAELKAEEFQILK